MQFCQSKVTFYGHAITDGEIKPTEDKVESIKNMRTPSSAQEKMSLLGPVTYLTRFYAKRTMLTGPLGELNKKGAKFKWELHHQEKLNAINRVTQQHYRCTI